MISEPPAIWVLVSNTRIFADNGRSSARSDLSGVQLERISRSNVETSASIIWVSWCLAPDVYFREKILGEESWGIRSMWAVILGITRHNTPSQGQLGFITRIKTKYLTPPLLLSVSRTPWGLRVAGMDCLLSPRDYWDYFAIMREDYPCQSSQELGRG